MISHTACPVAMAVGEHVHIYFGTRDRENRPSIGRVVIHMDDPLSPLALADQPVLTRGAWGMFDDNGVYPGSLVRYQDRLRLYYMGRSNGERPLYHMAIGIAESADGGKSFQRLRSTPVLSRGVFDPWMVSTPYVLEISPGVWTMWYLSGVGWDSLDPPISRYNIKVAHSNNGIDWVRNGETAFDFENDETNLASPCVWRCPIGFEAVLCVARPNAPYRIYEAQSNDGVQWQRSSTPIDLSPQGWDSECMAYPSTFQHNDKRYLLYSGNGNGRDGIGIAVEEAV